MVGVLVMGSDRASVFDEGVLVLGFGVDSEDGGEDEGELFGLDVEGIVDGHEVDDGATLAREDPGFLGEFDVRDAHASDGATFHIVRYGSVTRLGIVL
ncbi:hypothetical protein GOP47_0018061 [Adiantum capillus-veneris]|uniref:Uncharacterized protein n=1 Tax=Adiantum capillus-veneris TaxID=13818 RepID=A0A9D4UHI6_ADICA|nr:hypothetical protein GOP47_0018061 [Adiantum capillus-veneris]